MERPDKQFGMVSMCVGGGQGTAAIFCANGLPSSVADEGLVVGDKRKTRTVRPGGALRMPVADPESMFLLWKRWRTFYSPAARQARKAHQERLALAQRVAESRKRPASQR